MAKIRLRKALALAAILWLACSCDNTGKQVVESLNQVAAEVNAQCPLWLDQVTRLDSLSADPRGRVLQSYYSVMACGEDVGQGVMELNLTPILLEMARSEQLSLLREAKVTFRHTVRDAEGKPLWEKDITPKMYR